MGSFRNFIDQNVWKLSPDNEGVTQQPKPIQGFNPTISAQSNQTTDLDPEYLEHLYKFVEGNNIQGPDYFEFASALDEIKSFSQGMPEENLYKMAYVGFKTQGVDATHIVKTAEQYSSLLDKHKQEFDVYLKQEYDKTVISKERENVDLLKTNTDNQQKITSYLEEVERLKLEISQNGAKINENNQFIQTERVKLDTKRGKFELAFSSVMSKIKSDIVKIKNYLN